MRVGRDKNQIRSMFNAPECVKYILMYLNVLRFCGFENIWTTYFKKVYMFNTAYRRTTVYRLTMEKLVFYNTHTHTQRLVGKNVSKVVSKKKKNLKTNKRISVYEPRKRYVRRI